MRSDYAASPAEWDRPPSLQFYVASNTSADTPDGETPLYLVADLAAAELPGLIAALAAQLALAGGAS